MNQHWTPGAIVALVAAARRYDWGAAEVATAQHLVAVATWHRLRRFPMALALTRSAGTLLVTSEHVRAVYPPDPRPSQYRLAH